MDSFIKAAEGLISVGEYFHRRGWVLGTSGNFSAVTNRTPLKLAITSSGRDKGRLQLSDILEINENSEITEGIGKASHETAIHLAILRHRDAGAVFHTHSVWSTLVGEASAADGVVRITGYEMLKGLAGVKTHEHTESIPIIANSQNMASLAGEVSQTLNANQAAHGFLLLRHGLYTWGRDQAEALRHIEILEFLFEVLGRRLNIG